MASLNRPTEATYVIHDKVTVETSDNEDHTFCGILFPVKCKDLLPIDHVVINKVAVRGELGPLTVWISKRNARQSRNGRFTLNPNDWEKIYEKEHGASYRVFKDLELTTPVTLEPGETRALYIHSSSPGDEAIVYDNRHQHRTYDDSMLSILPGRAHLSTRPFGERPIWGWGNAWRDGREFVGRLDYGAVYKLWNPHTAHQFGSDFQCMVRTLFMCQRRYESIISRLPDDVIFYILNMCRWDWAKDDNKTMRALRKRRKSRAELAARAAEERAAASTAAESAARATTASTAAVATAATTTETSSASSGCCQRACLERQQENENEEFQDALEEETEDAEDEDFVEGEEEEDDEEEELDDANEEDEDESVDSAEWSDNEYHPNSRFFSYQEADSDDEDERRSVSGYLGNRGLWVRRQFARIHVLQALAALDDQRVIIGGDDDD